MPVPSRHTDLATARTRLEELAAAHGADEVLVVTIVHDHAARRGSDELLARAFEPAPRAVPQAS